MTIAAEVVERGMRLLDERGPESWRDRIDLQTLQIEGTQRCVLGQLYGGFNRGLAELGVSYEPDVSRFGFAAPMDVTYAELNEAWRLALSA